MAERLTRNNNFSIYNQNDIYAMYDKLAKVEDIMEKYGFKSVEKLDDFFINYKVSDILTEERIKEIAVNEQRKVIQSMIKEITEKECNNLYNEINTWKKACELACRHIAEVEWLSCPETDDISESENEIETLTKQSLNYFYQQAKNMEANSEKNNCNTDN